MAKRPTSSLAIAALVVGILSMVCCQIFGPLAIFLGVRSRRQVRESGEEGETLALIGLICGAVATAIAVVIIVFYGMIALVAFTTSSSTPTTYRPALPRTTFARSTTSRLPGTATRPPGATPLPAECARLRSALSDLEQPTSSTTDRLSASASVVMAQLGPASRDDVTTVLVDGLARTAQRGNGATPPAEVTDALARLNDSVEALCGP
jgi:hypothetical protein